MTTFVTQFDGCLIQNHSLSGLNCGCACGAMAVQFATGGVKHPSACDFRAQVRTPTGGQDLVGGTRPAQLQDAARRGWNVLLDGSNTAFDVAWQISDRADRLVIFQIVYAPVSGTKFDGSPGFRGTHSVVRTDGLVYDPLADGRRPGIPTAPDDWPRDLMRRASGLYANVGLGRAVILTASAPVIKPTRYSAAFTPGDFWTWKMLNGRMVHDAVESFSKATSAPCSEPSLYAWGTPSTVQLSKRRMVRIAKGALMGKFVEPGAAHVTLVKK